MRQLHISWTYRSQGGNQDNPHWSEIESCLECARHGGSVALTIKNGPEIGPQCLQVFCDRPGFLLMLKDDDGQEYVVRSFTNAKAKPGQVEILGDYWDPRMVCSDFAIVKAAFREFFDLGDVSRAVLD